MTAGQQESNSGLASGNAVPRCLVNPREVIRPLVYMGGVRSECKKDRIGASS